MPVSAADTLWPFLVYFIAVLVLVASMLLFSWLLGQRRMEKPTGEPFESGIIAVGTPQIRISVEFYLVAIFFVIFDLETVFIFAWAIAFFELGWPGFIAAMVFIAMLVLALIYGWCAGALEWGSKTRVGLEEDKTP